MPPPDSTTRADPYAVLLLASSRGDEEAFAALYDALSARVHGVSLRVLKDRHQAEEVTQEVFLQLWRTATRFDPQRGSAISWVLTLAHRRAVDRVRSCESGRRRDETHAEATRVLPFDETASAAHASLEAATVRAALASLTSRQREALELTYFGGLTHREVSGALQVPLGTTKSRIRDGLLQLRRVMVAGGVGPV